MMGMCVPLSDGVFCFANRSGSYGPPRVRRACSCGRGRQSGWAWRCGYLAGVLRLKRTPFMVIDLVSPSAMEMGPVGNGKITFCVRNSSSGLF